MIKKILITGNGKRFFYRGNDLHTQYGYIKNEVLEKAGPGMKVKTNTGREMTVLEPGFNDLLSKMKRSAQIIPLKDVGRIITETGIGKKSVVVDAGAGSGALCCILAHIAKKVYTYEIRDDFADIVRKNIEFLGLKNIVLKKKSIYDSIDEDDVDAITLDLPEPWKAIPHAAHALKHGGFLVSYSPTLPQVSDLVEEIRKDISMLYLKTIEIIEREWEIDGRKIRPRSQAIGHSGFLSFARKV